MLRRCLFALSAGAALIAASPPHDPFGELERVPPDELAELRGGFSWSGMDISFGAELLTFIDGELMLQTVMQWTDEGSTLTRYVNPVLEPAQADALAAASAGGMKMSIGGQTVYLTNSGHTALAHAVTEDGIHNFLFNAADSLHATQEVKATLDLVGYDGFREGLMQSHLLGILDASMAGAPR
ncbi:hypothetical protein GRI75_09670 [Altererythrobacter soli]|uniref:Uncharacterized protein n=1 Tax=Croceibacterium soli TaxID=1739690 RepID=A0A6I4UWW1_9SPHN|nr:hypothetical protein [Croceibacterium soli]MXP41907.1 hypothetical protein [Croceibacterium soli]